MAFNDVKSTPERVAFLKAQISQLRVAIQQCLLAEKYFRQESANTIIADWDIMWDGIKSRLSDAESMVTQVKDELTQFIADDGFVFQYQWEIGRRNMSSMTFVASTDLVSPIQTQDALGDIVAEGDAVKITGTANNNGIFYIGPDVTANELDLVAGVVDETCTTDGAKIQLVAKYTA